VKELAENRVKSAELTSSDDLILLVSNSRANVPGMQRLVLNYLMSCYDATLDPQQH
jgi:hypothetical protein